MSKPMDAMVPVELSNGKTIWQKIGTAFENDDPNKRHAMVISITAIPVSAFAGNEIKIYVYPGKKSKKQSKEQFESPPEPPPHPEAPANTTFPY